VEFWEKRFGIRGPGKVICVGLNYHGHAREGSLDLPSSRLLFGKFSNTVISEGAAICLPSCSEHVDAEAELAVVVGKLARGINSKDALDFVAGYTVAYDVSARDLQFADGGQRPITPRPARAGAPS
jgi:2,4-diketo-3-deoxy-L-fuconate hydrolase